MAEAEKQDRHEFSGVLKAAILLMSLGEETSSGLLRKLDKNCVKKISAAMAGMGTVTRSQIRSVVAESMELSRIRAGELRGGQEYMRRLLETAFGQEALEEMLEDLPCEGPKSASLKKLERADPKKLQRFLKDEHPQTVALILSQMQKGRSALLISGLPETFRNQVALRMASLEQIPVEIVDQAATAIFNKLATIDGSRQNPVQGAKEVADLINRLEPAIADELLSSIDASDEELGNTIRDMLFTFENIVSLDNNAIKEILARVDRKSLTLALKGTSDRLKEVIFKTMSQRGSTMLREDMEAMGPVKIKDVEAAQRQMIGIVRELEREGVISTRDGGQQYVV